MSSLFTFKTRIISNIFILMLVGHILNSQVVVTWNETATTSTTQKCFEISLSNDGAKDIVLAGQNYRMYYDTDGVLLDEKSISSILPTQYTAMKLVQHHFDVDASGFGVLPYDAHLGFINLATDLNLSASGGVSIPTGKNIVVASMCFDVVEGKTPVFTWAQDQLTHTYATAFVELATLEGGRLKKVNITDYKIVQNRTTSTQEAAVFDLKYFPNPFTDILNITFNESLSSDATLTIKDVFGKEIIKNSIAKGSIDFTINGRNLPNGALFIEIKTTDGQVSVMKAIKIE